ncbi:glycoside hydrolase family 125 protein [Gleimia hominis]|uniref:glycoside hydrolase family 125 protein n=1 Tax=Gleimia hominis TaxID=595468 RepID=UPI001E5C746B|nr:glycoside hydrolase family 125 protein [Gleimia hominis]WIK64719.1 glycoside hydrolase family 125 protein [Gleimia hominis]
MQKITNPAPPELVEALNQAAQKITRACGQVAGQWFTRLMLNTWQTTMSPSRGGVFVITGDIPAMWLRDSSAQLLPFLRFASLPVVARTISAVIRQQWHFINIDPYANAFNATASGAHFAADDLDLSPQVWERKYEIDSLAFPVRLAHRFWQLNGPEHLTPQVHQAAAKIVALWRTEQHHEERSPYRHVRPSEPVDTLAREGRGAPVAVTGMTWSGFRPSDDACTYGYNIPAQLMAVSACRMIAQFCEVWDDPALQESALQLAREIETGVQEHGTIDGVYAYEVDGLGNALIADDANMPSLLSLPLVSDIPSSDPIYCATRERVLSQANPYYYTGPYASGVGSPHTPKGYIWHIALACEGLTGSMDDAARCLETILTTDGGTGWTHESFDPSDPNVFTREWFSWSNSMACELMLHLAQN